MSMSGLDFGGDGCRTFRQISRDRLLKEMLQKARAKDPKPSWKVLIMDKFTVKIMSYSCKMTDITDAGVSLVEDLFKRREPLLSMDAIYFLQPLKENVLVFLSDMSGRVPLYRKAYVFFSSPISKELVTYIKNDSSVVPRIGALSEMNLEYFSIDAQGFITNQEAALDELFGVSAENTRKFNDCLNTMATRIATVFASLREYPFIHYRAAKSLDESVTATLVDVVPTKLAAAVWNILSKFKTTIADFPQKETCDLLILDRSIDHIAPLIHEWTYDAMCHDLLEMDGNKYIFEMPEKSGPGTERKEVLLEDHDPVWLELRYAHIADASERLHDKMANLTSKNKAAQFQCKGRDGDELSTGDLQKLVQALPQYTEQIERLSLHVEIAGKINSMIRECELRDIGQLEQDLVFGDAGSKEMINFLRTKPGVSSENKLRLMMIFAIACPDKFEGDRGDKLMQLAKLSPEDTTAVKNLVRLRVVEAKKASGSRLKFDIHKKKQAIRKERDEEQAWALSRFYPMVEELIEGFSKGELPKHEYPCMNEPCPTARTPEHPSTSAQTAQSQVTSKRSRRPATWAGAHGNSDDGYVSDSVLKSDIRRIGNRIFIFIIGGATRSELRAVHKLSSKLRREIVLGSSSLEDPAQFILKLKNFN